MKKLKTAAAELAENFTLSGAVMPGTTKVTVTAAKRLMVEGHQGILAYGSEHIAVGALTGKIHIYGVALSLSAMSSDTLIISGNISSVEFE